MVLSYRTNTVESILFICKTSPSLFCTYIERVVGRKSVDAAADLCPAQGGAPPWAKHLRGGGEPRCPRPNDGTVSVEPRQKKDSRTGRMIKISLRKLQENSTLQKIHILHSSALTFQKHIHQEISS